MLQTSSPSERRARQRRLIRADGSVVAVRLWPGRGRPVVLVHGFLDSSEGWDTFARTTHRPCYAIDLPGFGGSDCPPRGSLDCYADVVTDAVMQLGLEDFTLVGHSLGGAVVSLVVDRIPDRVRSLGLLAPAGYGPLPLAEWASRPAIRDLLAGGLPFALINPLLLNFFYAAQVSGGKLAPLELQARMFRNALKIKRGAMFGLDCLARHSRHVRTRAFRVRQSRYTGPVSVLWGSRDRLVPVSHAENIAQVFPQARLEVWDGMAHHPQVERPRQLARYLERCCARARREAQQRRRRAAA